MTIAKELANKLTTNELQIIGLSVKLGFTNGSVGKLEWELEVDEAYIYPNLLKDISDDLVEGFTSSPIWKLTHKRYCSIDTLEDDYYEGKLSI